MNERSGDTLRQRWEARRHTFADDVELDRSRFRRALWFSAGMLSLVLGIIGLLLPLVPTTPFIILAAAGFSRSSSRFYNAVMSQRTVGPLVYEWRERRTIPRRAKVAACVVIIITFGVTGVFVIHHPVPRVIIASIGASVALWIVTRPSAS